MECCFTKTTIHSHVHVCMLVSNENCKHSAISFNNTPCCVPKYTFNFNVLYFTDDCVDKEIKIKQNISNTLYD